MPVLPAPPGIRNQRLLCHQLGHCLRCVGSSWDSEGLEVGGTRPVLQHSAFWGWGSTRGGQKAACTVLCAWLSSAAHVSCRRAWGWSTRILLGSLWKWLLFLAESPGLFLWCLNGWKLVQINSVIANYWWEGFVCSRVAQMSKSCLLERAKGQLDIFHLFCYFAAWWDVSYF